MAQAVATNFDDATFDMLFKDQLQEKELARILLEYGNRKWDDKTLIAEYVFGEIDELDIEDKDVYNLVHAIKELLQNQPQLFNDKYFIYHQDKQLSSFVISLLNHPYEESKKWIEKAGQNMGYQKSLFNQEYEAFLRTVSDGNEDELNRFKLISEDRTRDIVISSIRYLKLKKIKRMLLQNQQDMELDKAFEKFKELHFIHRSLKDMEREITDQLGTVILH
ncbi:hypothetical protein LWM68_20760 [Niabella sp. W65]|nr:hypothetical protein [Niabella sp. W65]MCH7364978.1 hypothetical protein [Niabella sp. W65]